MLEKLVKKCPRVFFGGGFSMSVKQLFVGAAVVAMATFSSAVANAADVAPPEALSHFSGQIDASLGYWFMDGEKDNTDPDETSAWTFGADGKFRIDLFDGVAAQADFSFEETDANEGDDYYQGSLLAGGHLSWSNPDSGLLGIFAATGSGESDEVDSDFWLLGGEGQLYLDNITLYVQAGYFDAEEHDPEFEEDDDAFQNAWFGRIVGRYFFSPETRLQGEFSYANGEQDDDNQDMDVYSWGARFDQQIVEHLAIFAAYNGGYFDNGSGNDTGSYYDHVIRGGISITLGRSDLISTDRTGPNLDMPWAGHWAASGNIVD